MATKRQNFIVGIFVLAGFVVLGGLIIIFGGGRTLLTKTYTMQVLFTTGVTGVQGGQSVTLNGKRIGETKDIVFVDEKQLEKGVTVVVTIEGYELPVASEMIVSPPAMGLGKPLIELEVLDPKDARKLPMDGTARIVGRMSPAIDQLVPKQMQNSLITAATHLGELAAALTPVAKNLTVLLESREMSDVDAKGLTANMATMIQRFDATLKSFNQVIGNTENQKNFADVLANARKISESGVSTMQNVSEASTQGKQLVQDTTQLLRKLTTLAEDMSVVMKRMDGVVLAMTEKSGTVGLLFNDNRLYEEMLLTLRRMSKMLDDFREVADLAKKGQLRIKAF